MFNKLKPTESKSSRSTVGAIEAAKNEIGAKEGILAELVVQQQELQQLISQNQQAIEISKQELEALEIRESQEKREAEIAAELQQLRPLADTVNRLTSELIEALGRYEKRIEQLKPQTGYQGRFETETRDPNFIFPKIAHQVGLTHFVLKAQYKAVKKLR